jgi:hypothetical protein
MALAASHHLYYTLPRTAKAYIGRVDSLVQHISRMIWRLVTALLFGSMARRLGDKDFDGLSLNLAKSPRTGC